MPIDNKLLQPQYNRWRYSLEQFEEVSRSFSNPLNPPQHLDLVSRKYNLHATNSGQILGLDYQHSETGEPIHLIFPAIAPFVGFQFNPEVTEFIITEPNRYRSGIHTPFPDIGLDRLASNELDDHIRTATGDLSYTSANKLVGHHFAGNQTAIYDYEIWREPGFEAIVLSRVFGPDYKNPFPFRHTRRIIVKEGEVELRDEFTPLGIPGPFAYTNHGYNFVPGGEAAFNEANFKLFDESGQQIYHYDLNNYASLGEPKPMSGIINSYPVIAQIFRNDGVLEIEYRGDHGTRLGIFAPGYNVQSRQADINKSIKVNQKRWELATQRLLAAGVNPEEFADYSNFVNPSLLNSNIFVDPNQFAICIEPISGTNVFASKEGLDLAGLLTEPRVYITIYRFYPH